MKIADVRAFTPDQLADNLISLKKEQFNLRFQAATGQVEKTHRVNEIRRDIEALGAGFAVGGAADHGDGAGLAGTGLCLRRAFTARLGWALVVVCPGL